MTQPQLAVLLETAGAAYPVHLTAEDLRFLFSYTGNDFERFLSLLQFLQERG